MNPQKEDAKQKVLGAAVNWYRAVVRDMKAETDALTWEDMSDDEKALFRRTRDYLQTTKGV